MRADLPFSREEIYNRLRWLNISRLIIATLLIGSLAFFQFRFHIYPFGTSAFIALIIVLYILSAAYAWFLPLVRNLNLFASLQIAGDILLISALVYLTGGIDSGFSPLYHLSIISGSIILYRRGGYLSASLASIFYGGMLDMQYYNVLFFERSHNYTAAQVFYHIFINIVSFYTVAFLSSFLAERLKKTKQELQAKKTDFEDLRVLQEHILRNVGNGIVTLDLNGRVTSWNEAAADITGYKEDEIRHKWHNVFGESIKGIFGHTKELQQRPFHFDGIIKKKDGSTAILRMTASLLKDEKTSVRGIILVFQDITHMVEMEERVRRQDRLATIGSLAAGIAHEIRNPLASLSGSIEMLKNDLHLSGDSKRLMEIVLREADRLNTIITEFLEYARPSASSFGPVLLRSVVDETVSLLKNSRDYRPDISISTGIPPDAIVYGDAQRLRQVFWNLLLNSCQAMPAGGEIIINAAIEPGTNAGMERVVITVSDSGGGIPAENLTKIFDPFFTTKPGGTGLGLAIVYRIIEDHGGTIDVQSDKGHGTIVTITLPAAHDRAAVQS